ncbi:hypothetical protein FF38_04162 [Lucilia cuprina]|uniref:Cytochrome c oxidase assembly factor 6 n=1 Tax=Lucilia cuprina TaxID=7375 RepID=A0A0L0C2E3_LUCCU|nr:hypothetical protein FF38_04162 [Lucilia cuprina]
MSFLNKEERAKCWGHRDEYWKCLSENAPQHSSTSGEKVPDACKKLRKLFETSCPSTWGYDPLDEKAQKTGQ